MKESRYTEKLRELYAFYKEVAVNVDYFKFYEEVSADYFKFYKVMTLYFYNTNGSSYSFETICGRSSLIQEFLFYSWLYKYKNILNCYE